MYVFIDLRRILHAYNLPQYKLDGEREFYDTTKPSTTACPLLPGQRMNVLEVPFEMRSRSSSAGSVSSNTHTMDPADKYRNPRPPPLTPGGKFPRLDTTPEALRGRKFHRSVSPLAPQARAPFSAGPHREHRSRSPLPGRKVQSAGSSPVAALRSAFSLIKGSREESRPVSRGNDVRPVSRGGDRGRTSVRSSRREFEISSPVLISRTDADRPCVPVQRGRASRSSSGSRMPARPGELSPLRSHPVDPIADLPFAYQTIGTVGELPTIPDCDESLSEADDNGLFTLDNYSSRTSAESRYSFKSMESHGRSRSLSTGRVREPSPLRHCILVDDEVDIPDDIREAEHEDDAGSSVPEEETTSQPQQSSPNFSRPRPFTRQEVAASPIINLAVLNKDLPDLPSYLIPEPLRIRTRETPAETPTPEAEEEPESRSHFSVWSTTSVTMASFSSDDGLVSSPTYSSLTESSSGALTPPRFSHNDILDYYSLDLDHHDPDGQQERAPTEATPRVAHATEALAHAHTDFNGIRRPSTSASLSFDHLPGRFQGYSLPASDAASSATLTKTPSNVSAFVRPESPPLLTSQPAEPGQEPLSQMEQLMKEFSFLGTALT